jgi:hypothetical protein
MQAQWLKGWSAAVGVSLPGVDSPFCGLGSAPGYVEMMLILLLILWNGV